MTWQRRGRRNRFEGDAEEGVEVRQSADGHDVSVGVASAMLGEQSPDLRLENAAAATPSAADATLVMDIFDMFSAPVPGDRPAEPNPACRASSAAWVWLLTPSLPKIVERALLTVLQPVVVTADATGADPGGTGSVHRARWDQSLLMPGRVTDGTAR